MSQEVGSSWQVWANKKSDLICFASVSQVKGGCSYRSPLTRLFLDQPNLG